MRLGKLLGRTKALLSRPLERATARSMRPLITQLEVGLARQIEQIESRQHNAPALGRLDRLETEVGAARRAVEAVAEQQRAAGDGLGRKLERLEEQVTRQEQAIQTIAEQHLRLSATVDERLERAHEHLTELIDEGWQNLAELGKQQNDRIQRLQGSVANSQEHFNELAQKLASLSETVERLPTVQTLKGLGIEDHLLESFGSVPPLHPIGDWRIGIGIDNPTNLLKERVSKWNQLKRPVLLVWHADLKVMIWPGNESSRQLFVTGTFEPSEMCWLADNLKDDMVFIDVGANMGIYTMFAAKLVGAGGRVLAVEPSEREFQRLSFHVVLNGLGNVTCLRFAAADKGGIGKLKVAAEENSGHNTLGEFVYESTEKVRVETVRMHPLDRVIAEHKFARVDVIKIDVEGAELHVLRGLADTVARWRPKLLIELSPDALAEQETSPEALIDWLRSNGYELFEFSRSTGEPQALQSIAVQYGSKNLVATPER